MDVLHCIIMGLWAFAGAFGHFAKGFISNTNSEIYQLLKNTWISKLILMLVAFGIIFYQCMGGKDMTIAEAIMSGYIAFSLSEVQKAKTL